jgi:2-oxoisovalerate dehydrogenase E1 component
MFFEHKALYRSISGLVPDDYYTIPFGKAKIVKEGTQATIVTYGMGVHQALKVVNDNHLDIEIIDLRTLLPLDTDTIYESVKKTNRVLVLHEDTLFGGLGGEISAKITENCFEYLDAPVMRLASLDTPVPFAKALEDNFLPWNKLQATIEKLLAY